MASNHLPPVYPTSGTETPLDLTVRRSDADRRTEITQHSTVPKSRSTMSSPPPQPYTSGDLISLESYAHHIYMTASNRLLFPGNYSQYNSNHLNRISPLDVSGSGHMTSLFDFNREGDFRYKSLTLPKKRKNIWRPYDSNGRRCGHEDHDSGSDTDSNSSSHNLGGAENLEDPVKRRRRNMLKFADGHGKETNKVNKRVSHVRSPNSSAASTHTVTAEDRPKSKHTGATDNFQGHSDDKKTSGVSHKTLFRWSPKTAESADNDVTSVTQTDVDQERKPLKAGCPVYSGRSDEKPEESGTEVWTRQAKTFLRDSYDNSKTDNDSVKSDKTETNIGIDMPKLDKKEPKKINEETKKGLSLIDLIEEIEADAMKKEQEETEKTRQRNANIVKLLEQCNHVKLQALDYLMSNVLIQDRGPTFKNRNEKVQKMLKGDKITSVNMLDVLELQVEMGLN